MINPVAKEIKVDQLNLPNEVMDRLASLAMSVEILEHKRFSVSKTVYFVIELMNCASESSRPEVKADFYNLITAFNQQQKSLLIGLGAKFAVTADKNNAQEKTMDAIDRKYLNGARG